jgi:hypothetical protein
MRNFAAIIPASAMDPVNGELAQGGWGADNFSVPAFAGPNPTHALLHSWWDQALYDAVIAIPGVVVAIDQEPWTLVTEVTTATNTTWAQDALPLEGVVTPGLYFTMEGDVQVLWWVIQQYDTAQWPDPLAVPALVVPARNPGEITEWVQPINQFFAYFLVNEFTGLPDEVFHNGQVWFVSQADGAGLNVWEPGVFGWTVKT